MTFRRVHAPLAALAAVLLLASPFASTAAFGSGITHAVADVPSPEETGTTTWAIAPGGADGIDGRVSLRYVLDPGASASDHVVVTNFSTKPTTFRIYASDGVVTEEGNFDLIPPNESPTDGGSWITLGPIPDAAVEEGTASFRVEIPAGGDLVVPIQVSVPEDASPGDHPAGIVAELLQQGDSPVQFTTRVGVRAHLRVTGDVVANIVPQNIETVYHPSWNPFAPGTLELQYDLANEGNVRLGADVSTQATGLFGISLASASSSTREILPRQSTSVTEELTVWPLFFSWGEVSATPVIVGEDDGTAVELRPTTTEFTAWTIPWSQLAVLALLIGAILLIRALRKRSKARTQAKIDEAVAAAKADSAGAPPVPASAAEATPGTGAPAGPGEPPAAPPSPSATADDPVRT